MQQTQGLVDGPMMPSPRQTAIEHARRRWLLRGMIVALAAILIVEHRPLLVGFANLFRRDTPAPSDSLVVLSVQSELLGQFYRRGWAREVVVVQRDPAPFPDLNQFEVDREVLIRQGVPPHDSGFAALAPVRQGADDREIARRVREDLAHHPVDRITIAVSAHRSARMLRIFTRAFADTGVDVRVTALSNPGFNESDWYRSDEGLTAYFAEFVETIRDSLH